MLWTRCFQTEFDWLFLVFSCFLCIHLVILLCNYSLSDAKDKLFEQKMFCSAKIYRSVSRGNQGHALRRSIFVTASQLRSQWLDYFEKHGHTILPGSNVIPEDDPSLLFVNAGMNQFKRFYLGEAVP